MPSRRESRGLWVGVLAASFVLCGGFVVLVVGVDPTAKRAPARNTAAEADGSAIGPTPRPAPTGAFATGGVPNVGGPATRRVFATLLPRFVIALDAHAAAHHVGSPLADTQTVVDAARRNLVADQVQLAIGAPAFAALQQLLDTAVAAALASDKVADRSADALTDAMHSLNATLAATNQGYAIDTDVRDDDSGRRFVLVFSFSVERVRLYRAGTQPIRTLRLRRIDELGWHYNLLGFTTAERSEALIMLDQIDARLADRLLPQLADEPPPFYALEPAEKTTQWYRALSHQVSRIVRRAYADAAPAPKPTLRLGALMAQRKQLFAQWKSTISFATPTGLAIPDALMTNLRALTPRSEHDVLRTIQKQLALAAVSKAYAASRELLISSIERHEAQHRIDHTGARALPMPASLEALVGSVHDDSGAPRPRAMRARGELSAYIAELARDGRTSGVGLSIVTQFAIDSDFWGSAECYAAIVLLDSVSTAAGLPTTTPLLLDGRIDRAAVVGRYLALTRIASDDLQAAARSAWHKLFGAPLVPLILVR